MGVDIASLVLAVDSTQVDKGSESLNKLAQQGEKAASSAGGMAKAAIVMGGGIAVAQTVLEAALQTIQDVVLAVPRMTIAAINAADAMNDLHLKTGLAHKELAAYDLLARQSGSSIDGVAQGIKFLGKNLTENRKELADLGVTSEDTGVALGQFADLIASINDPALKTTLAMKYLGRAGVELLPTLSGGAAAIDEARKQTQRYGDLLTKVSPQADRFNDNLAILATKSKEAGLALANELLPRLNLITDNIVKAAEKGGTSAGVWAGVVGVFKQVFNPLQAIALTAGASFTEVTIAFNKMMANFTTGDVKAGFLATAQTEAKNLARIYRDIAALDVSGAAEAGKAADARKKLTKAEEEAIRTAEERSKAAKKAAEEHAAAVKAADSFIASLRKEVETYNMSEAEKKKYEATTVSLTLNKGKERDAFMASAAVLIEQEQALRDLSAEARIHNDIITAFIEQDDAANKKTEDGIRGLRLKIEAMNEETLALTLTASQLREHIILRELEKSGLEASTEAYKQMDAQLRKASSANAQAKEAKKAADEQRELWRDIERAGHDAFMHIGESGQSVFERLKKSLEQGLLEMLYRMTMKKWIIQIEQQVTGGGVSGGGGGGGGLLGGLFEGVGDFFRSAFSPGFGDIAGLAAGVPQFAGGGNTGSGARSGGLDGQGGFLAMLHPQETVIDRTKSGSGQGSGAVSVSMPVSITIQGNADDKVIRAALNELEGRIYRNVPAVIRKAQINNRVTPNV